VCTTLPLFFSLPPVTDENKISIALLYNIGRYMKTGQFTAISVGTGIDRHNVAAIVPLGKPSDRVSSVATEGLLTPFSSLSRVGGEGKATLVLSVDKETYEQLGLEGKKSVFKTTKRYSTSALMQLLLLLLLYVSLFTRPYASCFL
jgi:hypothetical protein